MGTPLVQSLWTASMAKMIGLATWFDSSSYAHNYLSLVPHILLTYPSQSHLYSYISLFSSSPFCAHWMGIRLLRWCKLLLLVFAEPPTAKSREGISSRRGAVKRFVSGSGNLPSGPNFSLARWNLYLWWLFWNAKLDERPLGQVHNPHHLISNNCNLCIKHTLFHFFRMVSSPYLLIYSFHIFYIDKWDDCF